MVFRAGCESCFASNDGATWRGLKANQRPRAIATKAIAELTPYGERASRLRSIAEFLVLRRT